MNFRYRFKDAPVPERNRDRDFDRERDFSRDNRDYNRDREREYRDRDTRDHSDYYYENYDRGRSKPQWNTAGGARGPPTESYYPPEIHQSSSVYPSTTNRYFFHCLLIFNLFIRMFISNNYHKIHSNILIS